MAWWRGDDRSHSNPKLLAVDLDGTGLYWRAVSWSAQHESDGLIPALAVPTLAPGWRAKRLDSLVARLVAERLWEETDGGYLIRDFLEYNRSRSELEEVRGKKRAAGRIGGIRSSQSRSKTPSGAGGGSSKGEADGKHGASGLLGSSGGGGDEETDRKTESFSSKIQILGTQNLGELEAVGDETAGQGVDGQASGQARCLASGSAPTNTRPVLLSTSLSSDSRGAAETRGDLAQSAETDGLVERVVAVCRGTNRLQVGVEARALVGWALGAVDRRILDEAIGVAANFDQPPALPRAIAAVVAQKARDRGVTVPAFAPPRLNARAVRHANPEETA